MRRTNTIRKFISLVMEGKIGVDRRLLKPHHLDLGRVSDYLKNGFPAIWIQKSRPLDYRPADIIYGVRPIQGIQPIYYLSPEKAEVFGDILKIFGPGNDHFWIDIWTETILPEEKTAGIQRGRLVGVKTVMDPGRTICWISLFKSIANGVEYVNRIKYLYNKYDQLEISFKYK